MNIIYVYYIKVAAHGFFVFIILQFNIVTSKITIRYLGRFWIFWIKVSLAEDSD